MKFRKFAPSTDKKIDKKVQVGSTSLPINEHILVFLVKKAIYDDDLSFSPIREKLDDFLAKMFTKLGQGFYFLDLFIVQIELAKKLAGLVN